MNIVRMLRKEEKKLAQKVRSVREAIDALEGWSGATKRLGAIAHKRKPMSAATRAKISRAQKAGWAKN